MRRNAIYNVWNRPHGLKRRLAVLDWWFGDVANPLRGLVSLGIGWGYLGSSGVFRGVWEDIVISKFDLTFQTAVNAIWLGR